MWKNKADEREIALTRQKELTVAAESKTRGCNKTIDTLKQAGKHYRVKSEELEKEKEGFKKQNADLIRNGFINFSPIIHYI